MCRITCHDKGMCTISCVAAEVDHLCMIGVRLLCTVQRVCTIVVV